MSTPSSILKVSLSLALATVALSVRAEQIKVRHPQGSAHGFVEVTTLQGSRIAVGDVLQRVDGDSVSSRLTLHFFDGSLDDETTVFTQSGVFRLISDHHVQKGPSFPKPMDATVDASKGLVTLIGDDGQVKKASVDMPPDTYNGLASPLLMNLLPETPETKIAIIVPMIKPRIIHLSMKNAGDVTFMMGGVTRTAIDYVVHVELGGLAGVIAPLIGKAPLDYHVWIMGGPDPAFIREQGQLYQGGPVWRIQQLAAVFPK